MQPNSSLSGQDSQSFIEAARRAQIIDAAIDVIADAGFTRASMARIATHAGISRGLISYHFSGKADLIQQVLVTVYTDGAHFMVPRIVAETTAAGQLRAYIDANIEYMRRSPQRMVAIVEIIASGGLADTEGDQTGPDAGEQVLEPLREIFRAGQGAGEFRDFDPDVMARLVRGAIDAVPPLLSRRPEFDLDHYARELTTAVELATGASPPQRPEEEE